MEVLLVWVLLSVFSTLRELPALRRLDFSDTDDATRLVQVRELLGDGAWYDLTSDRMGVAGIEMHWSRHIDLLVAAAKRLVDLVASDSTAELVAVIAVPLGLLLGALWLVSSIARIVSPRGDVGLYAMAVFAFGAGALSRLGPGRIDHHGLQIVLLLVMLRCTLAFPDRRATVIGALAGGSSLAIGLETLPVLAALVAGLGVRWASGREDARSSFGVLGTGLTGSAVASALLFGPPSRLWSDACDVFGLGYLSLVAVPALGLAMVGGRPWPVPARWLALGGLAALGLASWLAVNPSCVEGPYADLPPLASEIWLDLIVEAQGLVSYASAKPLDAIGLLIGPLLALVAVASMVRRGRIEVLPWATALAAVLGFVVWQVRVVPMAQALAAPAVGVLVVTARDRVGSVAGRVAVLLVGLLVLPGFAFGIADRLADGGDAAAQPTTPCVSDALVSGLADLEPGTVAVEMNFGPDVLVQTDHRVLAPPYHRAYEGVVGMYEMLAASPGAAEAQARALGVDYIWVCDDTAISRLWSADAPDGLLAALLADEPPPWLSTALDAGRSRLYAVRPR